MSLTASKMLPLGSVLPEFDLPLVKDPLLQKDPFSKGLQQLRSSELTSKPLLLMVLCAHCPFVKHIEAQVSAIQQDYGSKVEIIALSANSISTHPQDGPYYLSIQAEVNGWKFPYLFDQEQLLVKGLQAACTPDFFLFKPLTNGPHVLEYRGQLDESRPDNGKPVTGKDLRDALEAVLHGEKVFEDQKPSIGCNIKWHPGNEPNWFS